MSALASEALILRGSRGFLVGRDARESGITRGLCTALQTDAPHSEYDLMQMAKVEDFTAPRGGGELRKGLLALAALVPMFAVGQETPPESGQALCPL